MEIFTVVVFSRYPLRHFGLKYTSMFRWTLGYVYSAQDLNFCHQHRPYSLSLKFFFRLILRWNTSFWRSTEKRILTDQIRSSHKTSHVRTLWAQYEVMYVGAGGHAGPQTALLNHSSRGHHLYMHHLGTHEITSLTLHSRTDADTTFEGCEAEHECELCPRPVYVCVWETYQILNVAVDVFLHAWRPRGHPAAQRTELHRVRLVARTVTTLIQLKSHKKKKHKTTSTDMYKMSDALFSVHNI